MVNYSTLQITSKFPAAIAVIALSILFASGCAQKKELQPKAATSNATQPVAELLVRVKKVQSEGCRSCHSQEADLVTKIFSNIVDTPKVHHPVGVRYPDATVVPDFALPSGEQDGVVFFDRNGNGQADANEIMLFGTASDATVECATCHIEHGDEFSTWKAPAKLYLRFANTGSALCTTCHQY